MIWNSDNLTEFFKINSVDFNYALIDWVAEENTYCTWTAIAEFL